MNDPIDITKVTWWDVGVNRDPRDCLGAGIYKPLPLTDEDVERHYISPLAALRPQAGFKDA